jgi:hypothetical protein
MRKRIAALVLAACVRTTAQQADVLYDEAQVPKFTLPEALKLRSGEQVRDARSWNERRRPEILAIYETDVFGKAPAKPSKLNYEVKALEKGALGGKADRKVVTVYFGETRGGPKMDLLIYLPAGAKKAVPLFLGLNFSGIHTVANDPGSPLAQQWVRGAKGPAPESSRGSTHRAGRWTRFQRAMGWQRWTTTKSNRISSAGCSMGFVRCSSGRGKPSRHPASGARSEHGGGQPAGRWITWRRTRRSMASTWRCSDTRGSVKQRCGRARWIRDSRS